MAELRPTVIHGYADRLSVAPGERIEFKVSSEQPGTYRADVVRLIHGDTNPAGPGFKEEVLETDAGGDYEARFQPTDCGSCVVVEDAAACPRFQIVQTAPDEITLRLGLADPFERDVIFDATARALGAYLAHQSLSNVRISLAADPPAVDPRSGKFREVIAAARA